MFDNSLPSIEKFAAFLDGNLPQSEMLQFSHLAENDSTLQQLLNASTMIDDTITNLTDSDLQLPSDIDCSDFDIPQLPESGISQLVNLSPEPSDDIMVATACADADISMFSDVNQDEHLTLGGNLHDEPSLTISEDNGFDNSDDLSNSFSDNI